MIPSFEFDAPDHFTAGAVGAPGQRVFYLQAREGRRLVTLKSEKEQVRALAEHLAGLLVQLGSAATTASGSVALAEPLDPVWAIASLGIGYDEASERVVIVANSVVEEEGAEPASARFAITRAQAAAFVDTARGLVKAGRPICPMCSQPKDPGGHVCPRANGHLARS